MPIKVLVKSAYVYPRRRDTRWWAGGKYLGVSLQDIPRYYIEWYLRSGTDEALLELCEAWLSSLESDLVLGYYDTQAGFEDLANNNDRKV